MDQFDGLHCLPGTWLGTEHLSYDPECSCGAGGVPSELHDRACDRTRAPYLDHDTMGLVEQAVGSLVWSRGSSSGDAGAALSCLASLIAEAQSQLPGAVAAAHCQDNTWEEVARRLATTARTARRRYGAYVRWWENSPAAGD
jgi:hypothetical protein